MKVSFQLYVPATLPTEKEPPAPIWQLCFVWKWRPATDVWYVPPNLCLCYPLLSRCVALPSGQRLIWWSIYQPSTGMSWSLLSHSWRIQNERCHIVSRNLWLPEFWSTQPAACSCHSFWWMEVYGLFELSYAGWATGSAWIHFNAYCFY